MPPKFRIVVRFFEKLKIKKMNHLGWALPTLLTQNSELSTHYAISVMLTILPEVRLMR